MVPTATGLGLLITGACAVEGRRVLVTVLLSPTQHQGIYPRRQTDQQSPRGTNPNPAGLAPLRPLEHTSVIARTAPLTHRAVRMSFYRARTELGGHPQGPHLRRRSQRVGCLVVHEPGDERHRV